MSADSRTSECEPFRVKLAERVERWLASEEARRTPGAPLYRHLPDLFCFLARLALDERVPERDRAAVRSAVKYVVAPLDLIPEGIVGTVGFRDDLVLASFVVERMVGHLDPRLVEENWQCPGHPAHVARAVLDAAPLMVEAETWERLRGWVPS
ncbi:MAG: YkvA family protein [Acidobacteriota bacterium]